MPSGRAAPQCSLVAERARLAVLYREEAGTRADGRRAAAGLDEVGRGCLAGPVFAGAAVLDPARPVAGLDDSKALDAAVREDVARRVRRAAIGFGIGAASAVEIDALGIVPATRLAMRRALEALSRTVAPDFLFLDAFPLPGTALPQRALPKGDARVACIAAASVLAKVERDAVMDRLDRSFPHYGFARHRGYATPEHLDALRRHGPCPVHRLTFDRVLPARRAA